MRSRYWEHLYPGHRWSAGRSTRVAGLRTGLKRALEVCGAGLLLFLPLAVMFGLAHVWGVAHLQLPAWRDLLRRYPYPMLLLQGPAVHSEEKVISVIVYTVLVNYPLDVAASFYFHLWLWFCSVRAWNRLGRIFLHYFWGLSGFFPAFLHHPYTQSLLLSQPFCKTCSGFIE